MTNKIEQFLSEKFGEVRAIKENKIIWFVAKDVSQVLKYTTTQKVTDKVDDDDIVKIPRSNLPNLGNLNTKGGNHVTFINEGGLYQVVGSITKKDAERYTLSREFKRWITNEVIPTLRETGAYIEKDREQEVVDKYFYGLSDELKLQVFKELQNNNEKLKVKADKHDKFLNIDSTYNFVEVSKMLSTKADEEYGNKFKISGIALTKYLREKGILSKTKSGKSYTNLPNQPYEEYFDVVSRNVNDDFSKSQTRVKSSGIDMIYEELVLDGFQLN
ncbi:MULTISPECIES: BRO family protein [Lysinibacillus]|uniref:BRO family protein n=1 Tax=Lysinibacillus TaxID=400634 RepID=UPI00214AF771|nr:MULTISPECIES: BRO family protein [Lysinibacillus]UUV25920.1 BRO family protein [Lysinibacillus sp. FN11]UYB48793.1 BRO family protein [Lysinibacillus capsici]